MWYADIDASTENSDNEETSRVLDDVKFTVPKYGFSPRKHSMQEASFSLATRMADISSGVALWGTVPPPRKLSMEKVVGIATVVSKEINDLNPDGVVIYDIQDEPSRSGEERPFPFFETYKPREYARLLKQNISEFCEPIVYRALTPGESEEDFKHWCTETTSPDGVYGVRNYVLVGGDPHTGKPVLRVSDASRIMKQQSRGMLLGGITIPERHRDRNDEAQRITTKMSQGISFFTSQVIYNIDIAIWFLADYAKHCHEHKLKPARIVFTFAPFGSERTVKFMEWLGIEIPIGTQKRVLTRKSLRERVEESMRICWSNWRRILDYWKRNDLKIPIGFSVEAVSKSRMESRGAVVLFKACRELMDSYYDGVQDTLLKRMLNDDATYIVQTKDGGATISKLTDEEGPTLFATLPKMETSSNKGLRRIPTKPDFPALLKPKKKIAVPSIATPAAPLTVELQSVESPLPTLTTLPVDVPATNNSASI